MNRKALKIMRLIVELAVVVALDISLLSIISFP